MPADSALMLCAVAVGAAQMADCALLRSNSKHGSTAMLFAVIEWLWGALCTYLFLRRPDAFPRWLSGTFVVYLAAWTFYVVIQARKGRSAETFELSPKEGLVGGMFGAFYATTSLATWAVLSA